MVLPCCCCPTAAEDIADIMPGGSMVPGGNSIVSNGRLVLFCGSSGVSTTGGVVETFGGAGSAGRLGDRGGLADGIRGALVSGGAAGGSAEGAEGTPGGVNPGAG
ncbi:hypothetical protein [Amycolatopsis marina]|uniref:hypothetical protein n=1 Tax=Amycolatopsis marina TaxID=490629 RepID=UPI0011605204|nr:hypothetical protein [Amycolatopsis marina]